MTRQTNLFRDIFEALKWSPSLRYAVDAWVILRRAAIAQLHAVPAR